MNRILVTGASGLLGWQVLPLLTPTAAAFPTSPSATEIRALSRRPPAGGGTTPGAGSGMGLVEWIAGDLHDPATLRHALQGVDTVLHLATQPLGAGEDLRMTRALLGAAGHVRHLVYVSVVGLEALQSAAYYREKLACEALIADSGLPFSLLRATQFHEFLADLLRRLSLGPVTLAPSGVQVQPVLAAVVAQRVAQLALQSPVGRARDLAGPQALTFTALARSWHSAQGSNRAVLSVPLPIPIFRAWRDGAALAPQAEHRGPGWEEWLRQKDRPLPFPLS